MTDGLASFTLKNSDFNIRSFRSNVVLRWEWRPGSILYLVWQQNRRASEGLWRPHRIDRHVQVTQRAGQQFFRGENVVLATC